MGSKDSLLRYKKSVQGHCEALLMFASSQIIHKGANHTMIFRIHRYPHEWSPGKANAHNQYNLKMIGPSSEHDHKHLIYEMHTSYRLLKL